VTIAPRFAPQEVVLDGWVIPAGTVVSLSTAAANHDPAAIVAPARFDVTLEREPPLTFGGGAHYCLGANLARAEMQEALALLSRRLPALRTDGEVRWRPRTGIFGPVALPLAFTPTPAAA
jgi:cytochrome P450